jgi:hypothetical protein
MTPDQDVVRTLSAVSTATLTTILLKKVCATLIPAALRLC